MARTLYKKGDCILRQGDAADFIYILKSGEVVLRRDERDMETLSVGAAFGISGAGEAEVTYQSSAYVTSEECEVRMIPTETFRNAMGQASDDAKKAWSNVISKTVDKTVSDED